MKHSLTGFALPHTGRQCRYNGTSARSIRPGQLGFRYKHRDVGARSNEPSESPGCDRSGNRRRHGTPSLNPVQRGIRQFGEFCLCLSSLSGLANAATRECVTVTTFSDHGRIAIGAWQYECSFQRRTSGQLANLSVFGSNFSPATPPSNAKLPDLSVYARSG